MEMEKSMRNRKWLPVILFAMLAAAVSVDTCATQPAPDVSTPSAAKPDSQPSNDETPNAVSMRMQEIDRAYKAAMFRALSMSSSPRDWALTTLLVNPVQSKDAALEQQQTALLDRAVAAAPDDALVQWIALDQTNRTTQFASNHATILQTLERLEPDNAAVWMEALIFASKSKDQGAIDNALAQMAASKHYNEHFSDLIQAQLSVFKRYPWPSEYLTLAVEQNPELSSKLPKETASALPYIYTMVNVAAFAMPAYQLLVQACTVNPSTGENAARANDCATIGRLLVAHGTNMVANRIGSTVLRRSGTFNDDDVRLARDQDWIYQQRVALFASAEQSNEVIASMNDWIETGSELESWRRALTRTGKTLTPPVD